MSELVHGMGGAGKGLRLLFVTFDTFSQSGYPVTTEQARHAPNKRKSNIPHACSHTGGGGMRRRKMNPAGRKCRDTARPSRVTGPAGHFLC